MPGPAVPEGISSVVFAEPVRAIVDAMARSSDKLPGITAELMLKLRIATMVAAPSFLQITMPPGYGPLPGAACGKRPWPGQLDFRPRMSECLDSATRRQWHGALGCGDLWLRTNCGSHQLPEPAGWKPLKAPKEALLVSTTCSTS